MVADLIFEQKKHLGLITLNRPQALNALTLTMIKDLQRQLQLWEKDNSIQAIVIRSSCDKAFCAGGDVRWLYEAGLAKNPEQMQFFWHEYRLNHYIYQYKKPYIPLLDGITMGGGVGISLHGSHPVATERFQFAMPETGIGFFPDIGASYLLARCPAQQGIYLGLTGNRLAANEALALGMVKAVISSEKVDDFIKMLLEADLSRNAQQEVNACIQVLAQPNNVSTLPTHAAIENCFALTTMEEIFAALQAWGDEWALKVFQNLQKKSPLSLKITLALIQKAKTMSMAECIQMDYCLVKQFMQDHDFYEGVRALLIDKDKSPRWNPAGLQEVKAAKIADYFECGQVKLELIA